MKDQNQIEYLKKFIKTLSELVNVIDEAGGCITISALSEINFMEFLDIVARNNIGFHVKEKE